MIAHDSADTTCAVQVGRGNLPIVCYVQLYKLSDIFVDQVRWVTVAASSTGL
jgi:hypothetical protein